MTFKLITHNMELAASEGIVAASKSGGGNMRTQRHNTCQLSSLI